MVSLQAPESKSDVNPEEKTPKALGIRDQKKLERKLAWQVGMACHITGVTWKMSTTA